jgi:hypothetical protein
MTRTLKFILFGSAIVAAGEAEGANDDSVSSSPRLSAEIAAGLPKFVPKKPESTGKAGAENPVARQEAADPDISTLPAVTVTETKLPTDERILTFKGKAKKVMDLYMGDSDGLDRGVLNRFTLPQLWRKIPFLGKLPFVGTPGSMSNEDRAYDRAGANDPLGRPVPPPE